MIIIFLHFGFYLLMQSIETSKADGLSEKSNEENGNTPSIRSNVLAKEILENCFKENWEET